MLFALFPKEIKINIVCFLSSEYLTSEFLKVLLLAVSHTLLTPIVLSCLPHSRSPRPHSCISLAHTLATQHQFQWATLKSFRRCSETSAFPYSDSLESMYLKAKRSGRSVAMTHTVAANQAN